MSPKWNYILGATTIVVIIGGTIYAIKKSRDIEKAEEEAITLEEAAIIVARERGEHEDIHFKADIEVINNEPKPIKAIKRSEMENLPEEDFDESDLSDDDIGEDEPMYEDPKKPYIPRENHTVEPLKDFWWYEEGIDPKEDKELRHDPNSIEAKHQFIRMELADWDHEQDVYRIMLQLFEFPFIPTTDGDELLRTQIIDYKVQFFGFGSKWCREVSYADIIFHYARSAAYNCGEHLPYWVEYFLSFIEIEAESEEEHFDTMLMRLNSHSYFNEERQTYGLFGLTRESHDQAIRIANMNLDRSVTYEIEFNEFLKSCI